jgi:uncharacterized protein YlxP (DUF503 family)
MTIGILKLSLFIPESQSLKERRMVLHSLKARLRNTFNVALAQIDDEDKWQKADLAVVSVGRDRKNIDSLLCRVVNFVQSFDRVNLIDYETELI